MEPFLVSTFAVASSEIGDKTQLLALFLASRFNRPIPIILGMLVATLLNHAIAAFFGEWVGANLTGPVLHGILALLFVLAAVWILIPDTLTTSNREGKFYQAGIFTTTLITFFIAEIGDKTQIATALLAAQFHSLFPVILGTTLGMMLANVPIIFLGNRTTQLIPVKVIRFIASGFFLLLGLFECLQLINFVT